MEFSTESTNENESALFTEYPNISLLDNATTTPVPYVDYEDRLETYLVPTIFALIFIIGVLGNGCLILIFFRHRTMRNVPNTYILSLAVADLLVIVTTVPLTSVIYVLNSWPWGETLCTLSEFFKDLSIGVSVYTLTALSGDRFMAIVCPLRKFHGKSATRTTIFITVLIWLFAAACGIPAIHGSYIRKIVINKEVISICYPFPTEFGKTYAQGIVIFRFLVYYTIPLLLIAVIYAVIAQHLICSPVIGEINQNAQRQIKARRKVAVTVLAFVAIFAICFLPSHVFMLWFYFNDNAEEDYNDFWHILRMVGFCLSFANSCTNPVALYCVSDVFRKHFNRYLLCRSSSISRHHTYDKSREMTVTTQSTIYRRYPSKRFGNQSIKRNAAETTVILQDTGDENGLIDHEKMSCM
ncbi:hypothetical protein PVAND_007562 [Polypedilum vanderplanki]|uniref:G-protein coupled receptors family 1 profile domain-containing protein n=1 Tax=Polypedilum vanderplanki TaxID=319348 RepID=A0A9J6C7K2_POLVA|nr:hypothetical protein PVAND_007562 [Polypedilum vanderplanki]